MDFAQTGVLFAAISEELCAVAFEDCSVVIYSCKGRRLSSIHLTSPACRLEAYKEHLVALTVDGNVHRWSTRSDQKSTPPLSVAGLLASAQEGRLQEDDIVQLWIHSNGLPIIITRSERAFTLDAGKESWVMIASGWYADCSPIWEGRTRGRAASMDSISGGSLSQAIKEPIRAVESEINDLVVIQRLSSGITAAMKPSAEMMEEFSVAVTLKHLEIRLQGAALLESGDEYKAFLRSYAKKLSDEGIRNQAEDLCKSLLGPIYYTAAAHQDRWERSICGMEKRALLSDILKVMAKGRLLLGLVQTYQDHLKNVSIL